MQQQPSSQEVRAEARSKMKGKNRPSKRHRKKQTNIIEERKPGVKQRMREQVGVGRQIECCWVLLREAWLDSANSWGRGWAAARMVMQ